MPEALPELRLLPFFLAGLAAVAVGAGFYLFGGRQGRSWAVPLAAAILFYALSNYYALPDWAVISGVLVTPLLFHKIVRWRAENAARKAGSIELPDMTLRRVTDYSGKHVAIWTSAPEGPPRVSVLPGADPIVLTMDFEGETEDEYRVILRSMASPYCPGDFVLHHRDAPVSGLSEQGPLAGIPGLGSDASVRALPAELASRMLDAATVRALRAILDLRTEKREIYVHVNGPQLNVVASDTYSEDELPRLLAAAAVVIRRLRAIGTHE